MTLSSAASAQFIKAELEVSGLTCSMCSLSTQKSLKTLDFVGEIKPDLNKNIFYIQFKPGKTVDLDAIKQKVIAAGFSVSKLIAVFNFSQIKVSDKFVYDYAGRSYEFMNTQDKILDGATRFQVLDKDFVPGRVSRKYGPEFKAFSIQPAGVQGTGTAPVSQPGGSPSRLFHITLS